MKKINRLMNVIAITLAVSTYSVLNTNQVEAAAVAMDNPGMIVGVNTQEIIASVKDAANKMSVIDRTTNDLKTLNTMRGGKSGFKGFVGEYLEAQEATLNGKTTKVVNDNGPVDLIYEGKNGHKYPKQLKIGYENGGLDLEKYRGQQIVINKDNSKLAQYIKEGKKLGIKVVPSNITKAESEIVGKLMQVESTVTGSKTASLVPEAKGLISKTVVTAKAGLSIAKTTALAGGAFSLGNNLVKVATGEKEIAEAAKDVAVDTAVATVAGVAASAAGSAIASTTVGAAAMTTAASTAAAATSAVASTAVGGAALAAGTAATAAVAGAGTAAATATVGALATAGTAAGSAVVAATAGTAVGGAVASGVGAMAAGGVALGSAAIAAAPVVAVGLVVGAAAAVVSCIF